MPALLRTSLFLTLSIRDTPIKLIKHFISRTLTFLLSALLMPHASAPYSAVGTITPSYRHFLAFILILYCSAQFSAPLTLYTPHSFVYHIPFASTISYHLRPQVLKKITSFNGSPFGITCIRSPLPYLEQLITLLLPTLTLSFLLSHTLSNSLTSQSNFYRQITYRNAFLYDTKTHKYSPICFWNIRVLLYMV